MSHSLCVIAGGLSGCTHIYVIVLQNCIFEWWRYSLFSIEYVLLKYFYNYVYKIPYHFRKNSVSYHRKMLEPSSKVRDSSFGYKQSSAC